MKYDTVDQMKCFKISNAIGGSVSCLWPLGLDPSYQGTSHEILIYIGLEEGSALKGSADITTRYIYIYIYIYICVIFIQTIHT